MNNNINPIGITDYIFIGIVGITIGMNAGFVIAHIFNL